MKYNSPFTPSMMLNVLIIQNKIDDINASINFLHLEIVIKLRIKKYFDLLSNQLFHQLFNVSVKGSLFCGMIYINKYV